MSRQPHPTITDINKASAASVEGYVLNAFGRANRVRAPAEGGRGTKRNREAVTSRAIHTLAGMEESSEQRRRGDEGDDEKKNQVLALDDVELQITRVVDPDDPDDGEWDAIEVVVPQQAASSTPNKIEEKKEEERAGVMIKKEKPSAIDDATGGEGGFIVVDDESTPAAPIGVDMTTTTKKKDNSYKEEKDVLVGRHPAAAAPLGSVLLPRPTTAGNDDEDDADAYNAEAVMEKKYALKNMLFTKSVNIFVGYVMRGTFLRRDAAYPPLLQALREAQWWDGRWDRWRGVVEAAVSAARLSASSSSAAPTTASSLQPAWISQKKDGSGTSVGKVVYEVLQALHQRFAPPITSSSPARDGAAPFHRMELINVLAGEAISWERQHSTSSSGGGGGQHDTTAPGKGSSKKNSSSGCAASAKTLLPTRDVHIAVLTAATLISLGVPGVRLCLAFYARQWPDRAESATTGVAAFERYGTMPRRHDQSDGTASSAAATTGGRQKEESTIWCEFFCPQKKCFVSVNPCFPGVTTAWGLPYVVAFGGDHTVDVTPRYVTNWSSVHFRRIDEMHYTPGLLWKVDILAPPLSATNIALLPFGCKAPADLVPSDVAAHVKTLTEARCEKTATQRILDKRNYDISIASCRMLMRETIQLASLIYSESIPTTLTAARKHALYVTEDALGRYEGIYPKDSTTLCGYIKSKPVYQRAAVNNLRSREGWLRVGRVVRVEEEPYKLAKPPPSRPLNEPSKLFGVWQTDAFHPLPPNPDGSVPRYALKANWYVLMRHPVPEGLAHMTAAGMSHVARRTNIDYALCVQGFRQDKRLGGPGGGRGGRGGGSGRNGTAWLTKGGRWVPVIEGIVIAEAQRATLQQAHKEWRAVKDEQERAARHVRAMRWWRLFITRLVAGKRVQEAYMGGAVAASAVAANAFVPASASTKSRVSASSSSSRIRVKEAPV